MRKTTNGIGGSLEFIWFITPDCDLPEHYLPQADNALVYWVNLEAQTYWHFNCGSRIWEKRSIDSRVWADPDERDWLPKMAEIMGIT
jgi:hypothetical protein